jgi:hypothetical protein
VGQAVIKHSEAGQAIVELLVSSASVLLTLVGSFYILKISFDRHQCAKLSFERTREALNNLGERKQNLKSVVFEGFQEGISETDWGIQASYHCPGSMSSANEKVVLRKLGMKVHGSE